MNPLYKISSSLPRCYFLRLSMSLAVFASVLTNVVYAQPEEHKKLKRKVLSDCSAARTSLELLDIESRKELIPYLGRVLDLHINLTHLAPMSDPNHPASLPLSDPRLGESPLLSNPNEEVDAKRCALQLLERLKPDSFAALPEVFQLLNKATIPQSLRSEAITLARSVAQSFAQLHIPASPEQKNIILDLVKSIRGENGFVAHAALIELAEQSLPILVERISLSDESENVALNTIFESMSSIGIAVSPLIYPLLANSDEPIRLRVMNLLGILKPPLAELLPALIPILDDISPQVRHQCRMAIQQRVVTDNKQRFSLESTIQDALVTSYRIAPLSERAEMQAWVPHLLSYIDGLLPRFLALSQGAQRDLKRDLLESLAQVSGLSDSAYTIVIKALDDQDIGVRVKAVRALGAFTQKGNNAVKALNKVFQTLPPTKDLTERTPLLEAALAASAALSSKSDATLISHLIKSLEAPFTAEKESDYSSFPHDRSADSLRSRYYEHPAVIALVAIGEASRASLEVTAKKGNSDQARRAISALGRLPHKESSVIILTQLLSSVNQGTVNEAARALLSVGVTVIPHLRKTAKVLPLKTKLLISELLIILGEKTLADTKDLYKSLERSNCETRVHRTTLISDFTPAERLEQTPATIACLGQNHEQDRETLKALTHLSPLEKNNQVALLTIVRSPNSSSQLILAILDSASSLSLSPDLALPAFEELIKTTQGPMQIRIIRSLGKFGHSNEVLIGILKSLISDLSSEKARSYAAVSALAKTSEVTFNFKEWITEALDTNSYEQVRKLLRSLPPEQAEEILLAIIANKSERKQLLALKLVSELLNTKSSLPEVIEKLLTSADIQLKLAALNASIACCPLNSTVTQTLRELIFSSANQELLKIRLPESLREFLLEIIQKSSFISEQAFAQLLLNTIDKLPQSRDNVNLP